MWPAASPPGCQSPGPPLLPFADAAAEVSLVPSFPTFTILYTIIPWIGVMALGYAFGAIAIRPDEERRRACLRGGLVPTAGCLIVAIGSALMSGGADGPPLLFRVLNQRKYPASQLFLLM